MYIHIYTAPASNNLPTSERNVVLLETCKHRVVTLEMG